MRTNGTPLKADHDAKIELTFKNNNLDIKAPLGQPHLCRELLCLAITRLSQTPQFDQMERANLIPAGVGGQVKVEGNLFVVTAPLSDPLLCRRMLCQGISTIMQLEQQAVAVLRNALKGGVVVGNG